MSQLTTAPQELSFEHSRILPELKNITIIQANQYYTLAVFASNSLKVHIYDLLTRQKLLDFSLQEFLPADSNIARATNELQFRFAQDSRRLFVLAKSLRLLLVFRLQHPKVTLEQSIELQESFASFDTDPADDQALMLIGNEILLITDFRQDIRNFQQQLDTEQVKQQFQYQKQQAPIAAECSEDIFSHGSDSRQAQSANSSQSSDSEVVQKVELENATAQKVEEESYKMQNVDESQIKIGYCENNSLKAKSASRVALSADYSQNVNISQKFEILQQLPSVNNNNNNNNNGINNEQNINFQNQQFLINQGIIEREKDEVKQEFINGSAPVSAHSPQKEQKGRVQQATDKYIQNSKSLKRKRSQVIAGEEEQQELVCEVKNMEEILANSIKEEEEEEQAALNVKTNRQATSIQQSFKQKGQQFLEHTSAIDKEEEPEQIKTQNVEEQGEDDEIDDEEEDQDNQDDDSNDNEDDDSNDNEEDDDDGDGDGDDDDEDNDDGEEDANSQKYLQIRRRRRRKANKESRQRALQKTQERRNKLFAIYLRTKCTKQDKFLLVAYNTSVALYHVSFVQIASEDNQNQQKITQELLAHLDVARVSRSISKILSNLSLSQLTVDEISYSRFLLQYDRNAAILRFIQPQFWNCEKALEYDQIQDWLVYIDQSSQLQHSLHFLNLKTGKHQLDGQTMTDRPRQFFINPRWESSLVVRCDSCLFALEVKQDSYWAKLGFRFVGLEKNEEYVEREDEFDEKPQLPPRVITDEDFKLQNDFQLPLELSLEKLYLYTHFFEF